MNETNINLTENTGGRLLQTTDEPACTDLWINYVRSGIENEIVAIIQSVETLNVQVSNVTREFDLVNNLLVYFFDVEVAVRSPLNEHFLNRYVAGPFDSRSEQEDFLLYLQGTGCPDFESLTGVRFVLPAPASQSETTTRSTSTRAGLIAGLVAALSAVAILFGVFVFVRMRRDPGHLALEEQADDNAPLRGDNEVVSEVGIRTNQEVSTLGDPIGMASSPGRGDSSTVDSFSLDYDYQKAYKQSPSTVSGSRSGESASHILVDDEGTLDAHYHSTEDRIHVEAPAGVLGLVLETNVDGIPVVNAIKPNSVLASQVRIGDRLLSVDDHDVSVMLASEVSKLIASKRDQPVRRFVFERHLSQLYGVR